VQEDCQASAQVLIVADGMSFQAQFIERTGHEVHCPNGMMEAIVRGTRVNEVGETKLRYPPKALKPRVVHYIEHHFVSNGDETVHWIV
jgi:hypothetical protein